MKYINILFFFTALLFTFSYCNHPSGNSSSCMENSDANGKLFVFVGKKIEIKEVDPEWEKGALLRDSKFIARYRVLQKICGDYAENIITFTVYDHYGFPAFGDYQHVLLFLTDYKGAFYHEKYLFYPLYKAKDGKWAGPYPTLDFFVLPGSSPSPNK